MLTLVLACTPHPIYVMLASLGFDFALDLNMAINHMKNRHYEQIYYCVEKIPSQDPLQDWLLKHNRDTRVIYIDHACGLRLEKK